jgi:hypothetical protein
MQVFHDGKAHHRVRVVVGQVHAGVQVTHDIGLNAVNRIRPVNSNILAAFGEDFLPVRHLATSEIDDDTFEARQNRSEKIIVDLHDEPIVRDFAGSLHG